MKAILPILGIILLVSYVSFFAGRVKGGHDLEQIAQHVARYVESNCSNISDGLYPIIELPGSMEFAASTDNTDEWGVSLAVTDDATLVAAQLIYKGQYLEEPIVFRCR